MAAAANLVLKNNADVNVTYYPIVVKTGEEAVYVDRTSGVLALQSRASLFYRENANTRIVQGKVTYPVLDATNNIVDTEIGTFEYRIPKKLSATDRLDIRKRLAAFIADAVVTAAVDNGETPW